MCTPLDKSSRFQKCKRYKKWEARLRYVWTMKLREGCAEEYERQHREIWPEMLKTLAEAGMRNYSISRGGDLLVGVFETDDFDATLACLGKSEAAARWQQVMAKLVHNERDPETGYLPLLETVFWFPGPPPAGEAA